MTTKKETYYQRSHLACSSYHSKHSCGSRMDNQVPRDTNPHFSGNMACPTSRNNMRSN